MEKDEYATIYKLEKNYWWYKALQELVESYINKIQNKKKLYILDAGCGAGRMLEILNKYGVAEGVDCSRQAVEFCKKRGLKNVEIGDLNVWSPDKSYDLVICLDVIYHAGIVDDAKVLKKFHEILNADGKLILNLPAFNILERCHDQQVWGKRRYKKTLTVQMLNNIGFSISKATYRLPHLFFIILIKKAIEKISGSSKVKSDLFQLPSWLNKLFLRINRIENKLIISGINMPFGSSLFLVACKKRG